MWTGGLPPLFLRSTPQAERYCDFRRMLDDMGDEIDGIIVATPDHTHAVITMTAMERGVNVYTQKPLT